MEQQKPSVTGIAIGEKGYRHSLIYWGTVAVVVVLFLVTTISYWSGTMRVLDESASAPYPVNRGVRVPIPPLPQ